MHPDEPDIVLDPEPGLEPDLEPRSPIDSPDPLEHRLVSSQIAVFAVAAAILLVMAWAGLGLIGLFTATPEPTASAPPTLVAGSPSPSLSTASPAPTDSAAPASAQPSPSAVAAPEIPIERGARLGGRWRRIAAAGIAGRTDHVAVWTGTEMLVWGGITASGPTNDGAAYDPAKDRWRDIPASPVVGRAAFASAWSGTELYVWGGTRRRDGARFNPETNRWRRLPASGLIGAPSSTGAWTSAGFVVVTSRPQTAIYDPAANAWTIVDPPPLPAGPMEAVVIDGSVYVVAFGAGGDDSLLLAAFDPQERVWKALSDAPLTGAVAGQHVVAAGGRLLVGSALYEPPDGSWSLLTGRPCPVVTAPVAVTPRLVLANRFAIDLAARWCHPIPSQPTREVDGQLVAREFPSSVWTGRDWILWSGGTSLGGGAIPSDGIAFRPTQP